MVCISAVAITKHSRKPKAVDGKRAWFIGSGLASLAGAAFFNSCRINVWRAHHHLRQQQCLTGTYEAKIPETGFEQHRNRRVVA